MPPTTGGNGRDAGDLVQGFTHFIDVGVFGRHGGIAAEGLDGGIGVVALQRRVDKQRQRLRLAGRVAGERDRRTEFAERPRPAQHRA